MRIACVHGIPGLFLQPPLEVLPSPAGFVVQPALGVTLIKNLQNLSKIHITFAVIQGNGNFRQLKITIMKGAAHKGRAFSILKTRRLDYEHRSNI